jgi:hypothetical protein
LLQFFHKAGANAGYSEGDSAQQEARAGLERARATRRALLPPLGDRQARAGRRVGDGVFAGESEGDSEVAASDWSTCAIA